MQPQVFYPNLQRIFLYFFISLIFLVISIVSLYYPTTHSISRPINILVIILLVLLSAVLASGFILNKPLLTIDEKGVKLGKKYYAWDNIRSFEIVDIEKKLALPRMSNSKPHATLAININENATYTIFNDATRSEFKTTQAIAENKQVMCPLNLLSITPEELLSQLNTYLAYYQKPH